MSMTQQRGKSGFALRTLVTWFAITALILSSTFSVKVHAYEPETRTATLQGAAAGAPCENGSDTDAHSCHCVCQHFSGLTTPAFLIAAPDHSAAPFVAVADVGIPIPPSAPRRPPKA